MWRVLKKEEEVNNFLYDITIDEDIENTKEKTKIKREKILTKQK